MLVFYSKLFTSLQLLSASEDSFVRVYQLKAGPSPGVSSFLFAFSLFI